MGPEEGHEEDSDQLSCEEGLRQLGLLSLEKRGKNGRGGTETIIYLFSALRGVIRKMGTRVFSRACCHMAGIMIMVFISKRVDSD